MGQIVSSAAKPKRCNLNQLSQVPTPAAGEHILVSSDNSMNAAGQGNFDAYVVGDGHTVANMLEMKKLDDSISLMWDVLSENGTYDEEITFISKTLGSGIAPIAKIVGMKGDALVWNQLIKNGHFVDGITTNWSLSNVTKISAADGILTFRPNASQSTARIYQSLALVSGHKYFFRYKIRVNTETTTDFSTTTLGYINTSPTRNVFRTAFTSNQWYYAATIIEAPSASTQIHIGYYAGPVSLTTSDSISVGEICCFDLTKMYGSGNEPTANEFLAYFPNDYYDYNAGVLAGVSPTSLVSYVGGKECVTPLTGVELYGIGDVYDEWNAESGIVTKRIGSRAYASGDENDTSVMTDGTTTIYPLDSSTTSTLKRDTTFKAESGGIIAFRGLYVPATCTIRFANSVNSDLVELLAHTPIDSEPTDGSNKFVTSGGVRKAISEISSDLWSTDTSYEKLTAHVTAGESLSTTLQLQKTLEKGKDYIVVYDGNAVLSGISVTGLYTSDGTTRVTFNFNGTSKTSVGMSGTTLFSVFRPTSNDVSYFELYSGASLNTNTGDVYIHILCMDAVKGFADKVDTRYQNYNSALAQKELIKQDRAYYFEGSNSWLTAMSYDDISYLDKRIKDVPKGKHFIFTTDSHIDYSRTYGDGLGIGYVQKETPIIKYVKDVLGIKNVIFGGDAIGGVYDKYQAAQILADYANEKYAAFGGDFLFCIGNHEANSAMIDSTHTAEQVSISDTEIYKRTLWPLEQCGKAVFDSRLIDALNSLSSTFASAEEKEQLIAWAKMHYYYDDDEQKIRYVVVETWLGSQGVQFLADGVTITGYLQMDFCVKAMLEIPEGYDLVIVGHMMNLPSSYYETYTANGISWQTEFAYVLNCYKNKLLAEYRMRTYGANAIITELYKLLGYGAAEYRKYDFSQHNGSGRVFVIGGHYHADEGNIWSVRQEGKMVQHIGDPSLVLYDDSILEIKCDRSCGVGVATTSHLESNPYAYSYPDQGTEERLGTVNEVLFDVITITDNNTVVCTRFGAGSENRDRTYILPVAD